MIDLLDNEDEDLVYDQPSINVFIDLMWDVYYWPIMVQEFFPYCAFIITYIYLVTYASKFESHFADTHDY